MKKEEIISKTIEEAYVRVIASRKRLEGVEKVLENLKPMEVKGNPDDFLNALDEFSRRINQSTVSLAGLFGIEINFPEEKASPTQPN